MPAYALPLSSLLHAATLIACAALATMALQRFIKSFDAVSLGTMLPLVAIFSFAFWYGPLSTLGAMPSMGFSPIDWAVLAAMSCCGCAGYALGMVLIGTFSEMFPTKKPLAPFRWES